jgi:hypothetical protein
VFKNIFDNYGKRNVPLIGYFKNGNLVEATLGIQTKKQIITILEKEYVKTEAAKTTTH